MPLSKRLCASAQDRCQTEVKAAVEAEVKATVENKILLSVVVCDCLALCTTLRMIGAFISGRRRIDRAFLHTTTK
jgi:hypothetical protein